MQVAKTKKTLGPLSYFLYTLQLGHLPCGVHLADGQAFVICYYSGDIGDGGAFLALGRWGWLQLGLVSVCLCWLDLASRRRITLEI